MCIADMAAGRRSFVKQTAFTSDVNIPLIVPADPRRLGFYLQNWGTAATLLLATNSDRLTGWRIAPGTNDTAAPCIRVEQFGQLVTGPLYIFAAFTSSAFCSLVEIIADNALDLAIQREVD
jgi:hypothetical protein